MKGFQDTKEILKESKILWKENKIGFIYASVGLVAIIILSSIYGLFGFSLEGEK